MSEVTDQASGQAEAVSDESVETKETQQAKDQVSYDTYKKVLSEAKSAKAKKAELEAELQKVRQSELEVKGQDKQLIESLRKQLAEKVARICGSELFSYRKQFKKFILFIS